MIFHRFQQGFDSFPAIVIFPSGGERIGLIDEQYASKRRGNHFLCLNCGLTDIACNQPGTVRFDQLSFFQSADRGIKLSHKTGDGGLAGTGVSHEDHVHGHRRYRKFVIGSKLADLDEIDQALDIFFYFLQADESIQLLQQFLLRRKGFFFLFGLGFPLGLRFSLLCVLRALSTGVLQESGRCRGNEIKRIQSAG